MVSVNLSIVVSLVDFFVFDCVFGIIELMSMISSVLVVNLFDVEWKLFLVMFVSVNLVIVVVVYSIVILVYSINICDFVMLLLSRLVVELIDLGRFDIRIVIMSVMLMGLLEVRLMLSISCLGMLLSSVFMVS